MSIIELFVTNPFNVFVAVPMAVPPSAIVDVPIVTDEFASFALAIEPASIVFVTVAVSAAVIAVPDILVFAIAAVALISESTIVPSAIIVDVTVPVSVV